MRSHGNEIILIIKTQLSSKQAYTVVIIETTVKIFQLPTLAIYQCRVGSQMVLLTKPCDIDTIVHYNSH